MGRNGLAPELQTHRVTGSEAAWGKRGLGVMLKVQRLEEVCQHVLLKGHLNSVPSRGPTSHGLLIEVTAIHINPNKMYLTHILPSQIKNVSQPTGNATRHEWK